MNDIRKNREFLKSGDWYKWEEIQTDQRKKIPMPELQKSYSEEATKIDLVNPEDFTIGNIPLVEVISKRRSRRKFTKDYITIEEVSYLLWATQGVMKENKSRRTVPSGGARHPFETYLFIQRVKDIEPGLYRYLPVEHKLLFLYKDNNIAERIDIDFVTESAITFIWTTIPYRTEWRYDIMSHKVIAIEAGHICQNLYLASESINCGTCAIGAYDQEIVDSVLGIDGIDEFTIYMSPVGRIE